MSASLKVRSEGIQSPIYRIARFTYADLATTDFVPAFDVPGDAIPVGGFLVIDSVFDAASTISVGVSTDTDTYLTATSAAAAAKTALNATWLNAGKTLGTRKEVGIAASAAMTQGSGYLVVEYVRANRSQGTEG